MDYEIRYADSGVAPEEDEPPVRVWPPAGEARRPAGDPRRLEVSHEWRPRSGYRDQG